MTQVIEVTGLDELEGKMPSLFNLAMHDTYAAAAERAEARRLEKSAYFG